jgi:outer membrane protein assembly factor BamE
MEVQQGNLLDQNQVAQLQTGMTRSQVLYLLGTPMVPDGFDEDRWDYYHFIDGGRGTNRGVRQTRRLTVWFSDDKVSRIEDDAPPARAAPGSAPAPAGAAAGSAAAPAG